MNNEVIASQFDRLRGRMLGLIESWGLPASQERGAKSLLKSLSYDAEADLKVHLARLQEELADLRFRMASLEK